MVACGKAENHTVRIPNNFFSDAVHVTPQEYMDGWKKDAEKIGNYDINGYLDYNSDEEYTTIELSDAQLSEALKRQEEFLKQYQEEFSKDTRYRIEYDKDYKNIKYYIDWDIDTDSFLWSCKKVNGRGASYRVFVGYEEDFMPIVQVYNCDTGKKVTESDKEGHIEWTEEDWINSAK